MALFLGRLGALRETWEEALEELQKAELERQSAVSKQAGPCSADQDLACSAQRGISFSLLVFFYDSVCACVEFSAHARGDLFLEG